VSQNYDGVRSVFVAGPFWSLVNRVTNQVDSGPRAVIESVLGHFDTLGITVYNSHRRESWGSAMLEPAQFTLMDYEEINRSDLFVGFPGVPASPGTHIEIGWASAADKPMVLLLEEGREYAGLVEGLPSFKRCVLVRYRDTVDFPQLDDAVGAARQMLCGI